MCGLYNNPVMFKDMDHYSVFMRSISGRGNYQKIYIPILGVYIFFGVKRLSFPQNEDNNSVLFGGEFKVEKTQKMGSFIAHCFDPSTGDGETIWFFESKFDEQDMSEMMYSKLMATSDVREGISGV